MYHALYRKYRPSDFDSVVGQNAIVKTLKNSIVNNNFSHAYMFFGPRGTGKTSISKIFAKNINCLNSKDGNACGKCKSCLSINSNECVDIIEIDAASNNGVDEIRELKNNINLVPAELKYKVYIIDEVHMLSLGAFNALLKTLEEPPEHAIFILATTDPQKVPDTIVSRCQCFSFKRISIDDISAKINYVCKKEKIKIDAEVINKIALLSDGGLRDALGLLDKLTSYTDSLITLDILNEVNGTVSDEDILSLLNSIYNGKINDVLLKIKDFNSCGKNIIQIIIQIINYLRDLIIDYYLNKTDIDLSIDFLQNLVNLLNEKLSDIKKSSLPNIYIEMLILKFINENKLVNIVDSNSINSDNNNNNDNNNDNNNEEDDYQEKLFIPDNIDSISLEKDFSDSNSLYVKPAYNSKIINLDDVINARINNAFASANKQLKQEELKLFDLLKDYSFDQQIGSVVNALLDADLCVCGKNNIIISYESDANVEQNLENIVAMNEIYNKITNSNKTIAIVSKKRWTELKKEYISSLNTNNKYEMVKEPELLFEEIDKDDIISSSAIDLFGEDIVEIE